MKQILILLSVSPILTLFQCIHMNTKIMLKVERYKYILHARDALSEYSEFRLLTSENDKVIEQFIFEDILCRYDAC